MLRQVKIVLVITVMLWGLLGAFHNILDWDGTLGAVGAVTSMVTFEEGANAWQATSSPLVIWMGALFIMLSKVVAGLLCAAGAMKMWQSRAAGGVEFQAAKQFALAGCAIAVIMLFGGFIVIAEGWFELWRSDVMRGPVLQSALRYGAMIMLIALFVGAKEE